MYGEEKVAVAHKPVLCAKTVWDTKIYMYVYV